MTNEVYDKMRFDAKIHGMRLKTPQRVVNKAKNAGPPPNDIDRMTQDMFNRMKDMKRGT